MKDFYGNTIESKNGTNIIVGGNGDYKNDTVENAITRIDKFIDTHADNANGMWMAEKNWQNWGTGFKFLCRAKQCLVIVNDDLFTVWPSGEAGTDIKVRRVANNQILMGNSVTMKIESGNITFRRGDKPNEQYIYLSSDNLVSWTVFS